jgi:hypothetical protein
MPQATPGSQEKAALSAFLPFLISLIRFLLSRISRISRLSFFFAYSAVLEISR